MRERLCLFLDKLRGTLRSVTMWFNAGLATIVVGWPELVTLFPQLQPYVTPEQYRVIAFVVIAGNILIRFRTSKPLEDKVKP